MIDFTRVAQNVLTILILGGFGYIIYESARGNKFRGLGKYGKFLRGKK